jgi:hypothetical protein
LALEGVATKAVAKEAVPMEGMKAIAVEALITYIQYFRLKRMK